MVLAFHVGSSVQCALPDWRSPGAVTDSKVKEHENGAHRPNGQLKPFLATRRLCKSAANSGAAVA